MRKQRTTLGDWLPEKPQAEEATIPLQGKATLDVDQAIVEIRRKRRKGNATAGIVNAILLEGLDNDALGREARAAIVSTDMLMPDERARVEAIRENRDSEQCTVLLAILDGIAPYVSESKK